VVSTLLLPSGRTLLAKLRKRLLLLVLPLVTSTLLSDISAMPRVLTYYCHRVRIHVRDHLPEGSLQCKHFPPQKKNKTTFCSNQPTNTDSVQDLYGERGCLMGGIHGMFLAQYEVLRERGHSPSEAFNETVEEATQSLYPLIGAASPLPSPPQETPK